MKQLIVITLSLIVLGAIITGCADVPPTPSKEVEIIFYRRGYVDGGTDSISTTIVKAVAAFEKRNPKIHVKVVGIPYGTEGDTLFRAALEKGMDINVISVNSYELPEWQRKGYLSDIDPFLSEEDRADFYENAFQATTVNGKEYAYPLWVTAVAIYANPAILKERGVELPTFEKPWTWDQFVEAAKKLTYEKSDGTKVYGFGVSSMPDSVLYLPFFYLDGGRVLSPDGKRFVQNSPEAVSALQKVQDLNMVHHVTPPDFGNVDQEKVREQFVNGSIAMMLDTPNFIPDMQSKNVDFIAFPPPTGELGKIVTTGGFGMYGVVAVADQDKLAAAHIFAKYLTGSDIAKDVPGFQLAPGLRRSNNNYATDEARNVIAKLVSYGIYEPPVNIAAEVRSQYEIELQSIALGQKTPQEAMDAIAPAYQKELDILNSQ